MMDKYKAIREIPFSYPELFNIALQVSAAMENNIDKFAVYGITDTELGYLNELIAIYRNAINDEMMKSNVGNLVNSKKILRKSIEKILRSITARAKVVYSDGNPNLKAFNPGVLGRYTDLEFGEIAKGICELAVKEINELSKEGMTMQYLINLEQMIDGYFEKLTEIKNMKYEREVATAERHKIVTELYELLTKYCRYGKLLFEHESPATYKKFLMHRAKHRKIQDQLEEEKAMANSGNA